MRGQTYDGAANIAGRHRGAAALVAEKFPKAKYVHCSSHILNLCIVAASDVPAVTMMWSTMKQISIFFEYGPKRGAEL